MQSIKEERVYKTFERLLFLYLATYFAHNTDNFEEYINKAAFVIFGAYSMLHINVALKKNTCKYLLWFFSFLTYGFLSAMWALSSKHVFITITVYAQIICVLISMIVIINDLKELERVMIIFVSAVLYSLFALMIKQPNIWNWFPNGALNANGWHRNSYSVLLYISSMICLYLFLNNKKKVFILLNVVFTCAILPCTSRKTILMMIAAYILFFILRSKNAAVLLRNTFIGSFLAITVAYLIMNNAYLYSVIGFRFQETLNYFTGNGYVDFSTQERAYFIEFAKELFYSRPILGVGLDNFSYALGQVYFKSVYSHCTYWEILSCLGIVGFVIYYSWLGYLLFSCLKKYAKNNSLLHSWALTMMIIAIPFDYICITYNTVFTHFLYMCIYLILMLPQEDSDVTITHESSPQ